MKYNVVEDDGKPSSVTVFGIKDQPGGAVATAEHTNFDRILSACRSGAKASDVAPLFDIGKAVVGEFAQLSERITLEGGLINFDHDPVDNALTEAILRYYQEDNKAGFQPLVNFMEKISNNPLLHSRVSLFRWLGKHKFAIHPDGDFIAYKGVTGNSDDTYKSINSGTAIVNGKQVKGAIPNAPGTVIEMPRSKVEHNTAQACSTGLHAGSFSFARGFAPSGTVLRVKINPRDVVSVPTDAGDAKLRVCRYHVISKVDREDTNMLFASDVPTKRVPAKATVKAVENRLKPEPVQQKASNYKDLKLAQFKKMPYSELQWLAKEWEVPNRSPITRSRLRKDKLAEKLSRKASALRRKK